ncbi:MAG: TfoX/Sxy family protein [Candidatus Omnitrophica bacterium]|nr:TfoX/Sxy family protein [Candidatus Omnitrophota bacterium]
MPYDEKLAERIREILKDREGFEEKKMFGGLSFLLHGNMCCGVLKEQLIVRVGPDRYEEALAQDHATEMDFTGTPLRGFVYVYRDGFETDSGLEKWVRYGIDFAESLAKKEK